MVTSSTKRTRTGNIYNKETLAVPEGKL